MAQFLLLNIIDIYGVLPYDRGIVLNVAICTLINIINSILGGLYHENDYECYSGFSCYCII
jgi:hypothetical protein